MNMNICQKLNCAILLLLTLLLLTTGVIGSSESDSESNLNEIERWGYSFLGTFIVFLAVYIPPILFMLIKKDKLLYLNSYFISFGAGAILAVLFVDLLEIVSDTVGINWRSMSVLLSSYLISLLFAFGIRTEDECCENHHNNEHINNTECTHDEHKTNTDHCKHGNTDTDNDNTNTTDTNTNTINNINAHSNSIDADNTGDHSMRLHTIDLESPQESLYIGVGAVTLAHAQAQIPNTNPNANPNANPNTNTHAHTPIHTHDIDEATVTQHNARHLSPIIICGDAFCNFVDGLLIVIAFSTCSAKTGWEVTIAILMHEIPHEIGDFAILIRAYSYKKSILLNTFSGSFALIGCLVGNLIVKYYNSEELIGYILCVGIGGLMFVSTNVLPRAIKSKSRNESMSKCFVTGMGMALVTALLSQHTECRE